MNKVLICEGRCNPGLKALDEAIEGAGVPSEGQVGPPPPAFLDHLHALKHTVHVHVTQGVWACVECGEGRRF